MPAHELDAGVGAGAAEVLAEYEHLVARRNQKGPEGIRRNQKESGPQRCLPSTSTLSYPLGSV